MNTATFVVRRLLLGCLVSSGFCFPVQAQVASNPPAEEAIELETFVVETIAEGQAMAIREQRDADNIKNVITADAVGRLPDFSVGEALSRIAGISVQKDRGEPEYITIRGAAPRLNSVALNGDRIPSTSDTTEDRNDRAVKLNSVPTALISSIEVAKSVTPDLDADAVGGAVNLLTRSPLDLNRRVVDAKAEYGRNELNDGEVVSFSLTVADRFGAKDNWGFLLGASHQTNDRAINEVNINYGNISLFGVTPAVTYRGIQDFEYRKRFIERERKGINGQIDWEPSEGHRFFVRAFHNSFRDTEERLRIRNRFNRDGRALAGSGTDPNRGNVDGHRTIRQDRQGYKDTATTQLALGGRHNVAGGRLDYSLSHTAARFEVKREVINWENRLTESPNQRDNVADVRFDATDFEFPSIEVLNPAVTNPARFIIRNGRGDFIDQDDFSEESDTNVSVNFARVLGLGAREVRFKTGYRFRGKDTETVPGAKRYTRNSGTPNLRLADFLTPEVPETIFGRYELGPRTDFEALRGAFFDNRSLWTLDATNDLVNNRLNSYSGAEDINAGYVMGTTDLGALRLVGGVRYEHTANDYSAFRRRTGDTGLNVDEVSASSSYDNVFPGLLATYRINENLLLRAAWTNTIARPDYKDLAPFVDASIDLEDPLLTEISLTTGNPDLRPFESVNWDVSLEWYYGRTSYVSVGAFYKDITDFEFDAFTDEIGTAPPAEIGAIPGAAPTYRVLRTQPVNGPSASLQGVELSWSHKFDALPGALKGLGFIANATFIEGESDLPPGDPRVSLDTLPGQVDEIYNVQLYWENHRFATRVAWNFNGGYVEAVGAAPLNDIIVDESQTVDLSFEWKVSGGHRLYVEVKNLTEEYTERKYQGFVNKPTLREEAGRVILAGVKLEF